jgi:ABC-2 type transport system permease protein
MAEIENQKMYQEEFNKSIQEAEEEIQTAVAKFQEKVERLQREGPDNPSKQAELISTIQQLQEKKGALDRKLAIRREKLATDRDAQIQESRRAAETQVLKLQNVYKFMAIAIPPIPPLLVGIGVFVTRRVREREGISKNRLR